MELGRMVLAIYSNLLIVPLDIIPDGMSSLTLWELQAGLEEVIFQYATYLGRSHWRLC
jgi:hypothetical protein